MPLLVQKTVFGEVACKYSSLGKSSSCACVLWEFPTFNSSGGVTC